MGSRGQKKGLINTAGYFMASGKDIVILRTPDKKGVEDFIRWLNWLQIK
jgi:hypothetical protein